MIITQVFKAKVLAAGRLKFLSCSDMVDDRETTSPTRSNGPIG